MEKKQLRCKKDFYYDDKLEYKAGITYDFHEGSLDGFSYFTVVDNNLAFADKDLKEYFEDVYDARKRKLNKLLNGS